MVEISNQQLANGNGNSAAFFEIYKLARDCRDLLLFDTASRAVLKALAEPQLTYNLPGVGVIKISAEVIQCIKNDERIHAIKQLRTETGIGLAEANDAIKNLWQEVTGKSFNHWATGV